MRLREEHDSHMPRPPERAMGFSAFERLEWLDLWEQRREIVVGVAEGRQPARFNRRASGGP
jgi:hypothetical protein